VPDWCLRSVLAFPSDLGARRPCRGLRGWGCAHCQSLPRGELFPRERKRPRLHSQAGASPPRLSAARRESGSRCPWLGEAAPQPECCSVVPRKRLPDRAFPGAVLPPRGRWMCCAGFPWAFGLPTRAAAQGNQPMISELRAVTLVPGLEPNARNAGEKRLAAGGCLQGCTGKDRVSFHTGGAPALRPAAIAQSPCREAALCRASLPKACPASSVRAREGAGSGSVGAVSGA
jgi:hypothetical protein